MILFLLSCALPALASPPHEQDPSAGLQAFEKKSSFINVIEHLFSFRPECKIAQDPAYRDSLFFPLDQEKNLIITPETTLRAIIKLFNGGIFFEGADLTLWGGDDTLSPTLIDQSFANFKAYTSSLEKGLLSPAEAFRLEEFFMADPARKAICAVYENAHAPFEREGIKKSRLRYGSRQEYFRFLVTVVQRIDTTLPGQSGKEIEKVTDFEIMAQIFKDFFSLGYANRIMYDPTQSDQADNLPCLLKNLQNFLDVTPGDRDMNLLIQAIQKRGEDLTVLLQLWRIGNDPQRDHLFERIKGVILEALAQRLLHAHAWEDSFKGSHVFHRYKHQPEPWCPSILKEISPLIRRVVKHPPFLDFCTGDIAASITPAFDQHFHSDPDEYMGSELDISLSRSSSGHACSPYAFLLNFLNLNMLHLNEELSHVCSPGALSPQHQSSGLQSAPCSSSLQSHPSDHPFVLPISEVSFYKKDSPREQSLQDPSSFKNQRGLVYHFNKNPIEEGKAHSFSFKARNPFTMIASDLNAPCHYSGSEEDPTLTLNLYFQTLEISAFPQDTSETHRLAPSLLKTHGLTPASLSYPSFPLEEPGYGSDTLPYEVQSPASPPDSHLKVKSFLGEPGSDFSKTSRALEGNHDPAIPRQAPSMTPSSYEENAAPLHGETDPYFAFSHFDGFQGTGLQAPSEYAGHSYLLLSDNHSQDCSFYPHKDTFDPGDKTIEGPDPSIFCHDADIGTTYSDFLFPFANMPVPGEELNLFRDPQLQPTHRPPHADPLLSSNGPTLLYQPENFPVMLPASAAPAPRAPFPPFVKAICHLFAFKRGRSFSTDLRYRYSLPFPFRGLLRPIITVETMLGALIQLFKGGFSIDKPPKFPPTRLNQGGSVLSLQLRQKFSSEKIDHEENTLYDPALYVGQSSRETKLITEELKLFSDYTFFKNFQYTFNPTSPLLKSKAPLSPDQSAQKPHRYHLWTGSHVIKKHFIQEGLRQFEAYQASCSKKILSAEQEARLKAFFDKDSRRAALFALYAGIENCDKERFLPQYQKVDQRFKHFLSTVKFMEKYTKQPITRLSDFHLMGGFFLNLFSMTPIRALFGFSEDPREMIDEIKAQFQRIHTQKMTDQNANDLLGFCKNAGRRYKEEALFRLNNINPRPLKDREADFLLKALGQWENPRDLAQAISDFADAEGEDKDALLKKATTVFFQKLFNEGYLSHYVPRQYEWEESRLDPESGRYFHTYKPTNHVTSFHPKTIRELTPAVEELIQSPALEYYARCTLVGDYSWGTISKMKINLEDFYGSPNKNP